MPPKSGKTKNLFSIFKGYVLSSKKVVEQAIDEVVIQNNRDNFFIKTNFSELVIEINRRAYEIFLESQQHSWRKTIAVYLRQRLKEGISLNELIDFLGTNFGDFDSFFLSLTNSRRPRAGTAFQLTIGELFKTLDYPIVEQPRIEGIPDFLLPSVEYYKRNPIDCIVFTAKRTLRERWRQIVTEGTRGLGFFLATIDEAMSTKQLEEMSANRIYMVVPRKLKNNVDAYKNSINVITFEAFFEDHLDPAVKRWKRAGILE